MQKHKFNIFPEIEGNDFQRLVSDIKENGYDKSQSIVIFEGAIIDGWNRYRACKSLNVTPTQREFEGTQTEAIDFIMRTNKRRNLTSSQWACIANLAEDFIQALTDAAKGKQVESGKNTHGHRHNTPSNEKLQVVELIPQPVKRPPQPTEPSMPIIQPKTKPAKQPKNKRAPHTAKKVAKAYQTNEKYVRDAAKLKEEDPEAFEAVLSGKTTITKVKKTKKKEKQKADKEKLLQAVVMKDPQTPPKRLPKTGEWWQLGEHSLYCGDTSSEAFTTKIPNCAIAFADPPYNANAADWDNDFNWKHDYLSDFSDIVIVTPGISSIFDFARTTTMPYLWSLSCTISNGMTRGAMGFGNWIYAAIFSKGSIHRNAQDIITIAIKTSETDETIHKGRKPTEFLALLFDKFTKKGDTIIDPFLGSGQTLLVCEKTGRSCVGGEISPTFCAEIINRWETITGETAIANTI